MISIFNRHQSNLSSPCCDMTTTVMWERYVRINNKINVPWVAHQGRINRKTERRNNNCRGFMYRTVCVTRFKSIWTFLRCWANVLHDRHNTRRVKNTCPLLPLIYHITVHFPCFLAQTRSERSAVQTVRVNTRLSLIYNSCHCETHYSLNDQTLPSAELQRTRDTCRNTELTVNILWRVRDVKTWCTPPVRPNSLPARDSECVWLLVRILSDLTERTAGSSAKVQVRKGTFYLKCLWQQLHLLNMNRTGQRSDSCGAEGGGALWARAAYGYFLRGTFSSALRPLVPVVGHWNRDFKNNSSEVHLQVTVHHKTKHFGNYGIIIIIFV